jgi:hypothetical protein
MQDFFHDLSGQSTLFRLLFICIRAKAIYDDNVQNNLSNQRHHPTSVIPVRFMVFTRFVNARDRKTQGRPMEKSPLTRQSQLVQDTSPGTSGAWTGTTS